MKALLIGGTGIISMAISKRLIQEGHDLYLLNRGNRNPFSTDEVTYIRGDINDEDKMVSLLADHHFDVVADFIAFEPSQLERDYRLFKDRTNQFIFISSASAYQKPLSDYRISESTPLSNPYWAYSRNKIACESYLMDLYRNEGFPVTIIRPSHTYDERYVPLAVEGHKGAWQVLKRIMEDKPVLIHGDGSSLWTLTHNSDFAKGFVGIMDNHHAIGEAIHITSDESLTWNQIYEIIAKTLGKKLKAYHVASDFLTDISEYDFLGGLTGDKANTVVFDNSKLKRLVPDFVATKRFDQGIKDTIEHVLNTPELQKEDLVFDVWCDKVINVLEEAKKAF